ncbi:hypothetical protein [Poritiphilus flavus]|uniref:DUF4386 domain-containing protein n=1 Tax=Poritiphilus flavus TaxID=2697053 RepID=A0A6L9EH10_9FLAO|nr:hypothetical protein [Poritiphilus flavus]NAS14080.1 hypothetical protein [Poritiphilus flavus]
MYKSKNGRLFLKIAAICSFAGALTTALLIFLPNPEAPDFESRVMLFENSLYLTKLWILFLHPQLNLIASLGVAFLLLKKYPWQIILGTLFLLIWALTEMSQQALLIDALNQIWRPGYMAAAGEADKTAYETLIQAANGISDSKYFLVIYGFGLGSLFFGLAFIREEGFGKWIGWALVFIGLLSLSSFGRYYLGLSFLNPPVNFSYTYIYPYLQPLVRIAIGLWIFKAIMRSQDS